MNTPHAANIRPAASVLVLRDGARGVEVLLMRRPERDNDFRSGACVFPGGVVDAGDSTMQRWCLGLDDAAASRRLGLEQGGLDFFVAALRECFEEVGLLYVCRPDGAALDAAALRALRAWRPRLHRGEATIAQLCETLDCRLDLRDTAYFAHWLTPVVRPKRFDTRFFVRLAPPGQEAEPDFGEALELMWLTPAEALDPARALKLLNVTQRTLHELRGYASAREAHAAAVAKGGVQRILPRPVRSADGRERFVIPGQPVYDEVEALDAEGRGHVAAELAAGEVTRLSPRLLRIAGVRRHAYLVGGGGEAAVIDADPDDAAQWQALCAAAPTGVRWLLSLGDGPPGPAVKAQWPGASAVAVAAWAGDTVLALGADVHLRKPAPGGGLLLVEDGIVIGGESVPRQHAGTAVWLAGARGFLQRIAPRGT